MAPLPFAQAFIGFMSSSDYTTCSELWIQDFTFTTAATSSEHTTVHIDDIGKAIGRANEQVTVRIDARDVCDHHRIRGGDTIVATFSGPAGAEGAAAQVAASGVTDYEDGTYGVAVTLPQAGEYSVSVSVNGQEAAVAGTIHVGN